MIYKIGEFAILTNTSIRTLRYYDAIGILKPDEIDLFTNYRYYSEKNLSEMNEIKYLKTLNFSLDEIKKFKTENKLEILKSKKIELIEAINKANMSIIEIDKYTTNLINDKVLKLNKPPKEEKHEQNLLRL